MTENHSKGPQRTVTNQGIDIIHRTVLFAELRLSASIWSSNNRFLLSFLCEKSHVIGQSRCHWRIPVDILSHFSKIVEQYNNLEQVKM